MNYQEIWGLYVGSFSSTSTSAHPNLNFEKDITISYYIYCIYLHAVTNKRFFFVSRAQLFFYMTALNKNQLNEH